LCSVIYLQGKVFRMCECSVLSGARRRRGMMST